MRACAHEYEVNTSQISRAHCHRAATKHSCFFRSRCLFFFFFFLLRISFVLGTERRDLLGPLDRGKYTTFIIFLYSNAAFRSRVSLLVRFFFLLYELLLLQLVVVPLNTIRLSSRCTLAHSKTYRKQVRESYVLFFFSLLLRSSFVSIGEIVSVCVRVCMHKSLTLDIFFALPSDSRNAVPVTEAREETQRTSRLMWTR